MQLADRVADPDQPAAGVAAQLLALAGGRATASEVLNLAQPRPCGLGSVSATTTSRPSPLGPGSQHPVGIRPHAPRAVRRRLVQNTWRFGLDRILGVAMSDDSPAWLDTTLPLDDVSSNQVELAGKFAEYRDRCSR